MNAIAILMILFEPEHAGTDEVKPVKLVYQRINQHVVKINLIKSLKAV